MIGVHSEIGRLKAVVCHTPGPELAVVTPGNRSDYLFDDILDLEHARREHGRFTAILSRFAKVHEVADLLVDVLRVPEAREYLVEHSGGAIQSRAADAEPEEIARLFVQGEETSGGLLAGLVNEAGYTLPPLPNLFFTRDSAAVIGERVMVASMKHEVRWSEEILAWTLFRTHPELANEGILFDGAHERRLNVRLEGGDVHVLRRDLLTIGMSERTTAAGIDALAEEVFRWTEITDIVVVLIPAHRAAIHLDMIFTMLDRDLCCVFPPYFSFRYSESERALQRCRKRPACLPRWMTWDCRSRRSRAAGTGGRCRSGSSGQAGATSLRSVPGRSWHTTETSTRCGSSKRRVASRSCEARTF